MSYPSRKRTELVFCQNCALEYLAIPYEIKRGNGKFCSRNCQRSFQAKVNAEAKKCGLTIKEIRDRSRAKADPRARPAHHAVEAAIKRGDLVRQPCEECGAERVDAHHDDYDKPLDVRWLCRGHHLQHHRSRT